MEGGFGRGLACGAAIENAHGFTNAEGGIWRSNRKCAHEFTNAEGEFGLRACVYAGAPFVDLACTPPGWNLSPVNRVPLPTPGVRRSCILCAQSELSCAHQICHTASAPVAASPWRSQQAARCKIRRRTRRCPPSWDMPARQGCAATRHDKTGPRTRLHILPSLA